ncbi:MAG: hypothetical protein ACE37H_01850 [Phycisphaeraceae bacterium]
MCDLSRSALPRLAVLGLSLGVFVGCQAERAVVAPAEPTWSYREGSEQLSNNDAWEQLIPTTALIFDESQVASVEEPTR